MDDQHTDSSPQPTAATVRPWRKLTLFILLLIALALVCSLLYLLVWQHHQSSDEAYVAGHRVDITPQIDGMVQSVAVEDTQAVKTNQLLLQLDDSDLQLAYEQAQSDLIRAIRAGRQQQAGQNRAAAEVLAHKVRLARLQTDLQRRESLAGTDAVSGEELSHARAAVEEARAVLKAGEEQEKAARAAAGGKLPLRQQPEVMAAVSRVKAAWLALQRTRILAPADGQVAQRRAQPGQYVTAGSALMSVVPLHNLWVEAHFKQTQVADMRIGQPVRLTAAIYGKRVTYHGRVAGLSAGSAGVADGTGLRPEAVRVPVRIELDPAQLAEHPLRVGLSMQVTVDTEDQSGSQITAAAPSAPPAALPPTDWQPVESIIEQIFSQYAAR